MDAAAEVRREIEEIKTHPDRSLAYTALLHLQRRSSSDPAAFRSLALASPPLLPLLLADAHRLHEETAAQALKCLGFIIYHPDTVAAISERDAGMVVESLAELITATRMKAICNIGVWCISVQQLSKKVVGDNVDGLVRAVVYAIDNPFGSSSVTFEGIQVVMKLADQLGDMMRELSNIWLPPIYRRLISRDKRERDMAERCILKTKAVIFPPPSTLYKLVENDLVQNLLPRMMDMLHDHKLKVHLIQAWGWYVCLLDSNTLSNRHLVNTLLKIPEQTFVDRDPQVQITSLVAWETFIDTLLPAQVLDLETMIAQGGFQQTELTSSVSAVRRDIKRVLKRIKVIMVPLVGLLSSKCDMTVRSSCLSTWHYLLHKLDVLVNHPSVIMSSLMPVLKEIFSKGPDCRSDCVWTSCIDLLDEFVFSKVKDVNRTSGTENTLRLFDKTRATGSHVHFKCLSKHHPIRWLPWEINNVNAFLKMISYIISQDLLATLAPENRTMACDAASRIFRSVLQGVQIELKKLPTHHDGIRFCITNLLRFVSCVCDDMTPEKVSNQCSDLVWTALQFVKAIRDEIEPSILTSLLYQVPLDLSYIKMLSREDIGLPKVRGLGLSPLAGMDMVSPMVYTTILPLCLVAQYILHLADVDVISRVLEHLKFLTFSANSSTNLHAVICFLYMHAGKSLQQKIQWLTIWRVIAEGLKETIDTANGLEFLKTEDADAGHTMVHWFLCYPLALSFSPEKSRVSSCVGSCSQLSLISLQRDVELEFVMEVWKSLFDYSRGAAHSVNSSINSFVQGLCKTFIDLLDDNSIALEGSIKPCLNEHFLDTNILYILGEASIHLSKGIQVLDVTTLKSAVITQECGNYECSPIRYVFSLFARFLVLALLYMEENPQADHVVISRVLFAMASLVGRICLKQDILLLMEIISKPLVGWFSLCASMFAKIRHGSIIRQLQCLLVQILECSQKSSPPISFDSSFLEVQAPLLQATLDHPHRPISDASIAFWKATYGQQTTLSYPQCLGPALETLSRKERILLVMDASSKCVSNTVRSSILGKRQNDNGSIDNVNRRPRRKSLKMTKHAQKGRLPYVCGSGSGEDVELSGVFTKPQENQVVRKTENILQMLRRAS